MRLWRAHGLGNDYLVLDDGPPLDAALVRLLCDRTRGVGGDGVLEPVATDEADHGVRIWNPDGSIAEKSGNGLRIHARWLVERRGAGSSFTIHTGAERVRCEILDERPDGAWVRVAMGRARFTPAEIPLSADAPAIDAPIEVAGATLRFTAVGVGNPHCVVFCEEPLDSLPWREWGRLLEVHPRYPNRTNVQLARVIDRHTVEARIWERGAGETLASGSSSCAVAAAGVRTGRLDAGDVAVIMPGGRLDVRVQEDWELHLLGPVQIVGIVEVDARWVAWARSP